MAKESSKKMITPTPVPLAEALIKEVSSRGNVATLFANQFFKKFSLEECEAYIKGFQKRIDEIRKEGVAEKLQFLRDAGYDLKEEDLEKFRMKQ